MIFLYKHCKDCFINKHRLNKLPENIDYICTFVCVPFCELQSLVVLLSLILMLFYTKV